MQFSNFTRTEEGNKIFFKTETPLQGITEIKYYKDNSSGSFSKKEFRWSYNGDYWASWEILNQGNLTGIDLKGKSLLFLEIRYTSNGSGKVTSFTLNYKGAAQPTTRSSECPPDSNYVPIDKSVPVEVYNAKDKCDIRKDTLVDANTLCGKSCDYYLWRPNHKGEQPISTITNLQKVLNDLSYAIQNNSIQDADNVSGAGIGVYYGKQDKTIYFKNLIEGNKILISEDGAGHITVDMDDSSINDLYQLVGRIDGVNIGGGDPSIYGEVFKETVDGEFRFRSLASGNANVIIQTVGDQVRISLDASISGAPIWSDPDPISADVGGVIGTGRGGNYRPVGENSIEILEDILYEYFPPNLNLFLDPAPGYYEKWMPSSLLDVSVYGNFNNDPFVKAKITDVSVYATILGGFGHQSYPVDTSSGTFNFNDGGFNSNWDDITYTAKLYHTVNSVLMETDASADIKFTLPYIWGVVDNTVNYSNITPAILEGFHASGQKIIVPEQSNEVTFNTGSIIKAKFVYAYDATYGNLRSIFDVKNDFNVTTSFDTSILNIDIGVQTNIPYKVYIKSHWINVDTFKLIFNI